MQFYKVSPYAFLVDESFVVECVPQLGKYKYFIFHPMAAFNLFSVQAGQWARDSAVKSLHVIKWREEILYSFSCVYDSILINETFWNISRGAVMIWTLDVLHIVVPIESFAVSHEMLVFKLRFNRQASYVLH